MCDLHYYRSKRPGDIPISERKVRKSGKGALFLRHAITVETDSCIEWPHGKANGYGLSRVNGRNWPAHAWICTEAHGPKPFDGAHAAHSCGNRCCVNKRHVRWATARENIHDKALHGRQTKGEGINTAVLTREQVLEIAADSRSFVAIAEAYGCARSTVRAIHAGESWTHVTGITKATAKVRQPRLTFSPEDIEAIRADSRSCKQMAKVVGCSHSTINEIRRGLRN